MVIASGVGIDFIRNPFGADIQLNTIDIPFKVFGNYIHHISLWGDLLSVFWIVAMINVINFLDGLDGLAAGVTFIGFITMFILCLRSDVNQVNTAIFCLISAGAVLGFLTQNFNPAKIFMGDSGSMVLGFLLAVMAIISGGKVTTAFLVLGFPILDGLWVVSRRIFSGHSPFTADKKHLHHRLLALGLSQKSTVVIIYILTSLFGAIALLTSTREKMYALIWLLALMIVLAIALVVLEKKTKESRD
jgi:UDP-GlcNAc:undecaprenyl-phosphate GlcNAc-1-phosphate transferase